MSRSRIPLTLLALLALPALPGCVDRRLQIRSDPPGAEVVINGETVQVREGDELRAARTPVDVPFDHHGRFEVTLRHPDTLSAFRAVDIPAPITSYPPLDLFVEVLWPLPYREFHEIHFDLEPLPPDEETGEEKILARMRDLSERLSGNDR